MNKMIKEIFKKKQSKNCQISQAGGGLCGRALEGPVPVVSTKTKTH